MDPLQPPLAPPSQPLLWRHATAIDASNVHSDAAARNTQILIYVYLGVFIFFAVVILTGVCCGFRTVKKGGGGDSRQGVQTAEDCTDYLKIPD